MEEPLALLLLPARLEGFAHEAHARTLLEIPRVVALEPSKLKPPRFMRDAVSMRLARRLRLPGEPRLVVLYHPAQYPLARAICSQYDEVELWYVAPDRATLAGGGEDARELQTLDTMARDRARQTLRLDDGAEVGDGPLRLRLRELEIISHRPFVARLPPRRRGRGRRS